MQGTGLQTPPNAWHPQRLSCFCQCGTWTGNLIRTPDGKICILDFGLMTEVSPQQSMALVEYIAHLSSEDYNSIPGDLYKLGIYPAW